MIIHRCEQGSREWLEVRRGVPTASMFSKIIRSTGKPSTSAGEYMNKLVTEWLGEDWEEQEEPVETFWMERGRKLEPRALDFYRFTRGVEAGRELEVERVGFVFRDERRLVGCSPDWLVGDDGLAEVKCPAPWTHIGYLADAGIPSRYKPQVQGQLWVTGREWVDFVSFHPRFKGKIVRQEPDPKFQKALDDIMGAFLDKMEERRKVALENWKPDDLEARLARMNELSAGGATLADMRGME